jgi:primosomal protein N' (replication factor Y)
VALDAGIPKPLDYSIPEEKAAGIVAGMRVLVTLRGKQVRGTVLNLKEEGEVKKLHPIDELLSEEPALTPDLLELALWISSYYAAPLGKVVKSFLPASVRKESKPKTQLYLKSLLPLPKLRTLCSELRSRSAPQAALLDLLLKSPSGMLLSEALGQSGSSRASVTALEKQKAVTVKTVTIDRMHLANQEFFRTQHKRLNQEQAEALKKITDSLSESSFAPHLIHGVTGSGKTEVYLQAIGEALAQKKGAIYLVPEIALTSQTIERLKGRFEEEVAILHYRLSDGERLDTWRKIRAGKAPIVIGARSAIFSPVPNLGLIIVDEEHESSYKQSEESPKYQARDVAIMRAKFAHATVVLGSATPSLESYSNALSGKYTLSTLKQRATNAKLPTIHIVDMQREFARNGGFTLFSEALIDGMKKRIEIGEQTLLFLNRRGYHTSAQCPECAQAVKCPHCEISLTYHKRGNILSCHLCDHQIKPPRSCPYCLHEGDFKFRGAGTEMLERSLHALLPTIRTLRLDADTTKQKGSHEAIFKEFRSGKADILIGTQMIAKGLHFPQVTLVGVINTDGSLNIPDFRASETVFQLLTQVSGRSGRSDLPGEVIIQTHLPDHPIIRLASKGNYEDFYREEVEARQLFNFPPHTHLIKCTFAATNETECQSHATRLRKAIIALLPASAEILPLVPCGYAKIKSMYRYQCLIKCKNPAAIAGQIKELFEKEQSRYFRCGIDVDPTSTFF